MAVDQDAIDLFQPAIDALELRVTELESKIQEIPAGSAVDDSFIAFQDALWTSLATKTDLERVELLNKLAATAIS